MEVVLLQSAQADLPEIYSIHGDASYRAVDSALESIRQMPELAPLYHGHFRRKLVVGAPYGIFYSITATRLMVSFVMDLRQDPNTITRRLERWR